MVVTVKVTKIYGKMNFNRWALAITAVLITLTSRFPTTGYARVLSFIIIRRELGGTGTECLFQFTYCDVIIDDKYCIDPGILFSVLYSMMKYQYLTKL